MSLMSEKKLGRVARVTYREARKILGDSPEYYCTLPFGIQTISQSGEKKLMEYCGGILWLSNPPHQAVPFYQAFNAEDGSAQSADLLFGIGETVGCGERHASGSDVMESLKQHRVAAEAYEWYVEMKRLYPLQTAGFGMGIERFLLWLLKHHDIRDIPIMTRLRGVDATP